MHELSIDSAWQLLRECRRIAGQSRQTGPFSWRGSSLVANDGACGDAIVTRDEQQQWRRIGHAQGEVADFLELYLPLCAANAIHPCTIGHLGQSLDGYIATDTGDSTFVNDPQNILHLHRLRALSDAIVVGAATVRDDDPQLTTRRVTGPNPLRVIIDPHAALSLQHQVFCDGAAETLWVVLDDRQIDATKLASHVQILTVPADAYGRPDLAALLHALHARACYSVFVEGGGITVSRFMDAGLLDRIQLALAPVFIGQGRAGLRLRGKQSLQDCLRPALRVFAMGRDQLFDCDLRQHIQL